MSGERLPGRTRFGPHFESVLLAAQQGAPWALERLYLGLSGAVLGYLRVQGAADPEDLTNEVFLRMFRGIRSFDGDEDRFRSWIFTIAHSRLVDERRRTSRRPEVVDDARDADVDLVGGDAEADALEHLAGQRVQMLCEQLVADQRDVLLLRVIGRPDGGGDRRGPRHVRRRGQGPAAPGTGQPSQDSPARPRIPMTHFDGDVDEMPVPPLDDRALEALVSGSPSAQSGVDWLIPFVEDLGEAAGSPASVVRPAPAMLLAQGFSIEKGDLSATAASNVTGPATRAAGLPKWRKRK